MGYGLGVMSSCHKWKTGRWPSKDRERNQVQMQRVEERQVGVRIGRNGTLPCTVHSSAAHDGQAPTMEILCSTETSHPHTRLYRARSGNITLRCTGARSATIHDDRSSTCTALPTHMFPSYIARSIRHRMVVFIRITIYLYLLHPLQSPHTTYPHPPPHPRHPLPQSPSPPFALPRLRLRLTQRPLPHY